jgi:GNAT superfamily N-acetyltransferase
VVEQDGRLAACGGWSRRATLYGGDHSASLRDARLLEPPHDAARIRAMYTDPDFVRRGIGRQMLALCESAAREAGFERVELMATMAGEPLYLACGYHPIERIQSPAGAISVPGVIMGKTLPPAP